MNDRFSKEGLTFDDILLVPGSLGVLPRIRITGAGLVESHPHDISITKEAPHYQVL
ncbi:MAG: hypothetical protein ABFD08_10630 [Syntrophomonas sp.]